MEDNINSIHFEICHGDFHILTVIIISPYQQRYKAMKTLDCHIMTS